MKKFGIFLLCCFFQLSWAIKGVWELTDDNFDEYIATSEKPGVFIMFYVPWCGHCKHLKPIWDTIAKDNAPKYQMAKVNWYLIFPNLFNNF